MSTATSTAPQIAALGGKPLGRRRNVSTCMPCYSKKQKCNRQYPCNHCARRRRPEQCTYIRNNDVAHEPMADAPAAAALEIPQPQVPDFVGQVVSGQGWQDEAALLLGGGTFGLPASSVESAEVSVASGHGDSGASIAPTGPDLSELFGYYEESESNTLGLLRRVAGLRPLYRGLSPTICGDSETARNARRLLARMPPRPVIDFLIQFFLADVNWMFLLVHPSTFMAQYESWWQKVGDGATGTGSEARAPATSASSSNTSSNNNGMNSNSNTNGAGSASGESTTSAPGMLLTAHDIDFAVLILQTCRFTTLFLPTATHTLDSVRGMPLSWIRDVSAEVAACLGKIADGIDSRGSLVRIQHLCFAGLTVGSEGHVREAWTTLGYAVCLAQGLGFHRDGAGRGSTLSKPAPSMDELEIEMRRRVFCNLFVWDGLLSRQLDHVPCFNVGLDHSILPRMRLFPVGEPDNEDIPEAFTERVLQAKIVSFWRENICNEASGADSYDPAARQERHLRFQSEYVDMLPPAFRLADPDLRWDEVRPQLPLQRQLLYTAIHDSVGHNFRRLLLLQPARVRAMPAYVQVLLASQGAALALSAMAVLDSVAALHRMLGTPYTRLVAIIFHIFESGAILLCVCLRGLVHDDQTSPLSAADPGMPSRSRCIEAARESMARLQTLAQVSNMAEAGARSLAQLLQKVEQETPGGEVSGMVGVRVGSGSSSVGADNSGSSLSGMENGDSSAGAVAPEEMWLGTTCGTARDSFQKLCEDGGLGSTATPLDSLDWGSFDGSVIKFLAMQ